MKVVVVAADEKERGGPTAGHQRERWGEGQGCGGGRWWWRVSERQSEKEKKGRSKREKRVRKRKLCEISKIPMPHKGCI